MDGPPVLTSTTGNLFIDNLDDSARGVLLPELRRVSFRHREPIYDGERPMQRVIFPIGCVVSIVTEMMDGSTVEVGFIGREGMTGLPLALGAHHGTQRALIQVPNSAYSIGGSDFERCIAADSGLRAASLRYAQATLVSVGQFAACNRLHPTNERLARWLLMAHDRVPGDVIRLTHEFLAQMLGVRRAGVTIAALTLQRAGFIAYTQGHITIKNRAGLESVTCECYGAVEDQWMDILGFSVRKPLPDATEG